MLATLILGIAAGAATPWAEPKVKDLLTNVQQADLNLQPLELRMLTFALLLVAAAVLSMIFGSAHAFPLALGAAIGVLGPRAMEIWKARKRPDYDS